jgi:hypothetical protein
MVYDQDVKPEHMEVAMRHAKVIQTQKDVDNLNFEALEKLLDYPLSDKADVKSPGQPDMVSASELLQLFRPVDFTELIEERRLADKCGYILCPLPPIKEKTSSKNKIVRNKGQTIIVPKDKTEAWCSPQCVRRAAYVKYQLKTDPGWLRLNDEKIIFLFPSGEVDIRKPISEIKGVKPSSSERALSLPFRPAPSSRLATSSKVPSIALNGDEEALGDRPILSSMVVERQHDIPSYDPPEIEDETAHKSIEGYVI